LNLVFYGSYKLGKIGFFQGVYSQSNYKQISVDFDEEQLMSIEFANEDKLLRNVKEVIKNSIESYSSVMDYSIVLQEKSFYDKSAKLEILKDLIELNIISKKDEKKIVDEFKHSSSTYHYEDDCLSTVYSKIAFVINDYGFVKMFNKLMLLDSYFNNHIQREYKYRMRLSKKRDLRLRADSYKFYFDKEKVDLYYVDGVFKGMIIKYAKRKLLCIGERNEQYVFNVIAIKNHEIAQYNDELFERKFILEKEFKKPIKKLEYEKVELSEEEKIKINIYMYDKFLEVYSYSVEESKHNYKLDVDEKGVILIPKLEIKNIKI
jgi:hypothetical protein